MKEFFLAIVACARWEADHVGEWIEYHLSIGADHIYLYCNDDDAKDMANAISPYVGPQKNLITLIHYALPGLQEQMYLHFIDNYASQTEWFSFLDVDEFIFVDGFNLKNFIRARDSFADCFYFNWLIFGHKAREVRDRQGVLLTHDRRSAKLNVHTKVLLRSQVALSSDVRLRIEVRGGPFWHFWDIIATADIRIFDVLGRDLRSYSIDWFRNERLVWLTDPETHVKMMQTGFIAHFAQKSESDPYRRTARGASGQFVGQMNWAKEAQQPNYYKGQRVANAVSDRRLANYWLKYLASYKHSRFSSSLLTREMSNTPKVFFPPLVLNQRNIALNRDSEQSTTLYEHLSSNFGNNGTRVGQLGCYTDYEQTASWSVSFEREYNVSHIVIFGDASQVVTDAGLFVISLTSATGIETTVYSSREPEEFGGVESTPFSLKLEPANLAVKVEVRRTDPGFLHFEEIEIYTPDCLLIPNSMNEGSLGASIESNVPRLDPLEQDFKFAELDDYVYRQSEHTATKMLVFRALPGQNFIPFFMFGPRLSPQVRDSALRTDRAFQISYFVLHDVLVGRDGIIIHNGTVLFSDSLNQPLAHVDRIIRQVSYRDFSSPHVSINRACLLAGPGCTVWGHWLIDLLPRLHTIQSVTDLQQEGVLLIQNSAPLEARELLRLAGGKNLRTYDDQSELVHVKTLIVPTNYRRENTLHPEISVLIQNLLAAALNEKGPALDVKDLPTRIFLTRSSAPMQRVLINRKEIEDIAIEKDFSVIDPLKLSVADQIAAFHYATHIVGEYGSGLHNALFSMSSARVCALRGTAHAPGFVQSGIAQIMGQKTGFVFGTSEQDVLNHSFYIKEEDFRGALYYFDAQDSERIGTKPSE